MADIAQADAAAITRAAALTPEQRGGDAVGEERRSEVIENGAQHHLRLFGPAALKDRHPTEALQDITGAPARGSPRPFPVPAARGRGSGNR